MENIKRNYYGIIPIYILENRILPNHCKIAYAWLTSVLDLNNIASFPLKVLSEVFDVDCETTKRWMDLLAKERHIVIEYKVENEKEICYVELLFPQRPAIQGKENTQADFSASEVKKEEKQTPLSVSAVKQIIDLTPEQILRQNYNLVEIQKDFPQLVIEEEVLLWSLKLLLKYGKNKVLKDPKLLHQHFLKWISNSRHINPNTTILDALENK